MNTVFIDTSAFYAFLDGTDPHHASASDAFSRVFAPGWEWVTTSYVVHETWALLQARLGMEAVEDWNTHLLPRCKIIWVDAGLHEVGALACRGERERGLSLTDCVSMACMRRLGLQQALAFDRHFTRAGFRLP